MNRKGHLHRWLSIGVISILVLNALPRATAASAAPLASFIVQAASADQAAYLTSAAGGQITSTLEVIDAVAADLTPAAAERLKTTSGIRAVYANSTVKMVGDWDNDNHEEGGKGRS